MMVCQHCRYDHLSECLSKILDERPNDVLGKFQVDIVRAIMSMYTSSIAM